MSGFLNATEAEAEKAIAVLKRAIEAAENGNQAGENFVVGAASWNARPVYDEAAAEAEHEREMEAHSRVYGLRVGHTLTQVDYDAIQLYDKVSRRDQERALDAHHAGYKAGLRDGGSADIEKMDERLSNMIVEKGVESMMRTLAEQRGDEILAALIGVMDILARAESNASGNPEWDHVGPRVAAARAVVERFAAKQDNPND